MSDDLDSDALAAIIGVGGQGEGGGGNGVVSTSPYTQPNTVLKDDDKMADGREAGKRVKKFLDSVNARRASRQTGRSPGRPAKYSANEPTKPLSARVPLSTYTRLSALANELSTVELEVYTANLNKQFAEANADEGQRRAHYANNPPPARLTVADMILSAVEMLLDNHKKAKEADAKDVSEALAAQAAAAAEEAKATSEQPKDGGPETTPATGDETTPATGDETVPVTEGEPTTTPAEAA